MTEIPPITGVAEIVLSVADLPLMRQFYNTVLGFPIHSEASLKGEQHDPTGEVTISFLTIKELSTPLGTHHPQMLVLIDYQRHANAAQRFIGHDVKQSTLNHLAFEIPPDSYSVHWDRLKEMGLAPVEAEFPAMNAKAIFFKDPEGNALEFICRASLPGPISSSRK